MPKQLLMQNTAGFECRDLYAQIPFTLQVYEETAGLTVGDVVHRTKKVHADLGS